MQGAQVKSSVREDPACCNGVSKKKTTVKNMGQFTSLCIVLAWGAKSIFSISFWVCLCCSQHKALVLFCFSFLHFVCVCVGWSCCMTFGILVLWPRIAPGPTAVKALSPNHWTAKEFPGHLFCFCWCIYFQLPWVFVAAHRFSLVAVRGSTLV